MFATRAQPVAALALLLVVTTSAFAHDFWLLPDRFWLQPGGLLKVDLRVGDDYPGESFARSTKHLRRFEIFSPSQLESAARFRARDERPSTGEPGASKPESATTSNDVPGLDGRSPAGAVRITEPGLHTLIYESNFSTVDLAADKFEPYLIEKGLEKIVQARKDSGASSERGRERYRRCCKSLITVAPDGAEAMANTDASSRKTDSGHRTPIGMRLELVPEFDPASLRAADTVPVQLLFDDQPAVGVLVIATNADHPELEHRLSFRTDSQGRVSFTAKYSGIWVLSAVEMVAADKETTPAADWESTWASLSFEIPSSTATKGETPPGSAKP